ncbi:MAG: hypothetical protein ABI862_09520 [Ilumatobacteraceae bacterium]
MYLPDDLSDELKRRQLPASELLQVALRAGLERRNALDATDDYLAELAAEVGEPTAARRAAELRRRARRGSAVDAIVVALAEPGGNVLTGDKADIEALAAHAHDVSVETICDFSHDRSE